MIRWEWQPFANLASHQLYDALQLREQVFTIGQKCSDPDIDDVDRKALHLLGYENDKLIAYLRVYVKNQQQNIGRVVVHPDMQGKGIGREMMKETLRYLHEHYPDQVIAMSAQSYLEKFYQTLGFQTQGSGYMEAGIPHVRMTYNGVRC